MASGGKGDEVDGIDPALANTDASAFPLSPRRPETDPSDANEAPANSYAIKKGSLLAGKYRIVRTIGSGGMGFVLAARHEQLDAPVAMKLLSPELVARPNAVGRFLREARAASKLASSHVTRVLDVGTLPSGEPFMVMEYLAGEDLAYYTKRNRPSVAEAIDYIAQASDAIAEAHAAGIVHRDLKPANLFLTKRHGGGTLVKVLDFGVSKMAEIPGGGDVSLTTTSAVLGSALYMSPEQMRSSKHVDHRTDVYALGACLYELIGGAPPFVAGSFAELCAKAYTERPPLLSPSRANVSPELDVVIQKALAKEADDRFQTVAELVQALAPFANDATRGAIKALLAEYAPELELPPRFGTSIAPRSAPAPLTIRATREPPKIERSTWILIALGIAAVVVGSAALFAANHPTSGPASSSRAASAQPASSSAAVFEPAPTPIVEPAGAAVEPSGSPTASATSAAPFATNESRPDRSRAPRRPFAPASRTRVAPPSVDGDLTEERCTAHFPDGTTRVVPCP